MFQVHQVIQLVPSIQVQQEFLEDQKSLYRLDLQQDPLGLFVRMVPVVQLDQLVLKAL
jgi:hypothetical protein